MVNDGIFFLLDFLENPKAYRRKQEEDVNQQPSLEERNKNLDDLINQLLSEHYEKERKEKASKLFFDYIDKVGKERKKQINEYLANQKDPYLDLINHYLDVLKEQKNKQEENKQEENKGNKRKIILEEFNRFLDNYIGFDYQWDEEKALDEISEIEFEIKNVHGVETEFSLRLEQPKKDEEMYADWDIVDITFEPYGQGTKLQWRALHNFILEALMRVVMGDPKKQTKIDDLMKKNLMKKKLLN